MLWGEAASQWILVQTHCSGLLQQKTAEWLMYEYNKNQSRSKQTLNERAEDSSSEFHILAAVNNSVNNQHTTWSHSPSALHRSWPGGPWECVASASVSGPPSPDQLWSAKTQEDVSAVTLEGSLISGRQRRLQKQAIICRRQRGER